MESAILERPGIQNHPAQSAAGEPGEDASAAVESVCERGLRLLAELLAREEFIPEPSIESLRKYFPPLCGVLPGGLLPEHADDWWDRIEYYRGLILQLGCSHRAPRALLNAVRMWERHECTGAREMSVPHAPWYSQAVAEWTCIRDAHRARRPKGKPKSPPSPRPSSPRARPDDELCALWSPPDPKAAHCGLAMAADHLEQRLADPAYAQRYFDCIGNPVVVAMQFDAWMDNPTGAPHGHPDLEALTHGTDLGPVAAQGRTDAG